MLSAPRPPDTCWAVVGDVWVSVTSVVFKFYARVPPPKDEAGNLSVHVQACWLHARLNWRGSRGPQLVSKAVNLYTNLLSAANVKLFWFVIVFIGNSRSETNRVGGNRIILRSMHSKLHLRNSCSILSIKIEVAEMGVLTEYASSSQTSSPTAVSAHPQCTLSTAAPSFVHAARSRNKKVWQ